MWHIGKSRTPRALKLIGRVENMDDYDIVFIGYPNWWYSVPMAVLPFAESYNFAGKTVIPFCAHGTGGLARSIRDLAASVGEDTNFVRNAFGASRQAVAQCRPDVVQWLSGLGLGL